MIKIPELKRRKGQGAFEYILLVAGILLIVVIVVFLLKGSLQEQAGAGGTITKNAAKVNINVETQCLDFCGAGAWASYGVKEYDFNASAGNCTLADGVNGNASCYFSDITVNSNTGMCNASYVLYSTATGLSQLVSAANGTTMIKPQNSLFCAQIRERRAT